MSVNRVEPVPISPANAEEMARAEPHRVVRTLARSIRARRLSVDNWAKIRQSRLFVTAERRSRLLRFLVERSLEGGGRGIKEHEVGMDEAGRGH